MVDEQNLHRLTSVVRVGARLILYHFLNRSQRRLPSQPLITFLLGSIMTACAPITPPPSLPSPVNVPSMPSSSTSPSSIPSLPSPNSPSAQPSPTTRSGAPPSGSQDSKSAPSSQNPDFPKNSTGDGTPGSDDPGVFDPLAGEANEKNEKEDDSQELSWEKTKPSASSAWETSNEAPNEPTQSSQSGGSGEEGPKLQTAQQGKLQSTLDDFDREIMNERQVLAASEAPASESQLKVQETGQKPNRGPSADQNNANVEGGSGDFQVNAQPIPARRAVNSIPDDVPDARDDDIIARQIREAAMQEEDPVLKEKLWEEYKRYKRG